MLIGKPMHTFQIGLTLFGCEETAHCCTIFHLDSLYIYIIIATEIQIAYSIYIILMGNQLHCNYTCDCVGFSWKWVLKDDLYLTLIGDRPTGAEPEREMF